MLQQAGRNLGGHYDSSHRECFHIKMKDKLVLGVLCYMTVKLSRLRQKTPADSNGQKYRWVDVSMEQTLKEKVKKNKKH